MTKQTDGLHNQTWRQRGKGKQSAKGPLKKVLYINQSDGSMDAFFARNEFMLECSHLIWAYARNQSRIRCWKCRDKQAGGTTQLAPDAGDSAVLQAFSKPIILSTSQALSTPTQRG